MQVPKKLATRPFPAVPQGEAATSTLGAPPSSGSSLTPVPEALRLEKTTQGPDGLSTSWAEPSPPRWCRRAKVEPSSLLQSSSARFDGTRWREVPVPDSGGAGLDNTLLDVARPSRSSW